MNRRDFLKQSMAATSLMAGTGLLFSSCTQDLRTELMDIKKNSKASFYPDQETYEILSYASLAPSGHNSQPWFVKIVNPTEWIIGSDADRWLTHVDKNNREVLLSIGAFAENLVQAAQAYGYHAEIDVIAQNRFDAKILKVHLTRTAAIDIPLQRLVQRRTVKNHMLSKEIAPSDINDFSVLTRNHLFYFPGKSSHGQLMAKEAVDNFIIQFNNEKAMEEAAFWTRLKGKKVREYRDGLTVDGMEIEGIAGWVVRNFMDTADVMSQSFRDKGIEKIETQVKQGAGWIVITSDGNSVADLIKTGRRFQRMALTAREKSIAIHPMTQTLEEKHGQKNIKENHHPAMIPQFMLRVGYLEKYPDPVSLRRPVEWFVKN